MSSNCRYVWLFIVHYSNCTHLITLHNEPWRSMLRNSSSKECVINCFFANGTLPHTIQINKQVACESGWTSLEDKSSAVSQQVTASMLVVLKQVTFDRITSRSVTAKEQRTQSCFTATVRKKCDKSIRNTEQDDMTNALSESVQETTSQICT